MQGDGWVKRKHLLGEKGKGKGNHKSIDEDIPKRIKVVNFSVGVISSSMQYGGEEKKRT